MGCFGIKLNDGFELSKGKMITCTECRDEYKSFMFMLLEKIINFHDPNLVYCNIHIS